MNYDEPIFLILNSRERWNEMLHKSSGTLSINDEGMSIKSFIDYTIQEPNILQTNDISGLDVDFCNTIFVADYKLQKIIIFEPNQNTSSMIDINFKNKNTKLRVGQNKIFVFDDNILYSFDKSGRDKIKTDIKKQVTDFDIDNCDTPYLLIQNKLFYLNCEKVIESKKYNSLFLNDVESISFSRTDNNLYFLTDNKKIKYVDKNNQEHIIELNIDGIVTDDVIDFKVFDSETIIALLSDGIHNTLYRFDSTGKRFLLKNANDMEHFAISNCGDVFFSKNSTERQIFWLKRTNLYYETVEYESKYLDSQEHNTQWHKVIVESTVSENSRIEISNFATNDKSYTPNSNEWSKATLNPKDYFIQEKGKGRFLKIKIKISSFDGKNTPRIKSIKAYFPRITYLKYLPSIYQRDVQSKEFLERFLSIFETSNKSIEDKIFAFGKYIDPFSTEPEFLPWLASWVAISYSEQWPDEKMRWLIKHAPKLYRMRGTKEGLEKILLIYLSKNNEDMEKLFCEDIKCTCEKITNHSIEEINDMIDKKDIFIFENLQLNCASPKVMKDFVNIYGDDPYSFCVLIKSKLLDDNKLQVARKIVNDEKPAHTIGGVSVLQNQFRLNFHTYLGINTNLGSNEPFVIDGSTLDQDEIYNYFHHTEECVTSMSHKMLNKPNGDRCNV